MSEKTITDFDIQNKISELSQTHGAAFNKEKFREDAEKLKENDGSSLDSLNIGNYTSQNNNNEKDNNGTSFSCSCQNGVYTARGSDGTILKSKNFYDLNLKIAAQYKAEFDKEGKTGTICFTSGNKNPKEMEDFAKAFINSGIRVSGDIPQDPKFWQQFRQEYLSDSKHSAEEWDKLTANLPDKLIGRQKNNNQNTAAANNQQNLSGQQNRPNSLIAKLMQSNQSENQPQEDLLPKRPQRKPTKSEIKKMRREGFNPRDPEQVARYLHQKEQKHKQERNNTAANMPRRDDDYSR